MFRYTNNVGIFYSTVQWAEYVFKQILDIIPQDDLRLIKKNKHEMSIILKGGTYITFIFINNNFRGKKFDRIYYQGSISKDIVNLQLRPMWYPQQPMELEI